LTILVFHFSNELQVLSYQYHQHSLLPRHNSAPLFRSPTRLSFSHPPNRPKIIDHVQRKTKGEDKKKIIGQTRNRTSVSFIIPCYARRPAPPKMSVLLQNRAREVVRVRFSIKPADLFGWFD
jgi:hypothetical protein